MNSITKYGFMSKAIAAAAILAVALPTLASAATLDRQLELKMSGTDVSTLQTFLAQDVTIYPQGLVTGYFGYLTKSAVSNFQSRNGIPSVGRVGPVTLVAINAQLAGGMSNENAPVISDITVNSSNNSATVSFTTNEAAKVVVFYSTSPLVTYERTNSVDVSGQSTMTDNAFRTSQNISISNLQANTNYYYMVYTTDQTGNVSVSWPSTFHTGN